MTALIAALAGGAIGLLTHWVLQRRDEARVGGAAERRLRADFQNSLEILRDDPSGASEAWLNPGLRVTAWRDQFDRLVPRFLPARWDRMNDAVDALDRLQAWAESHSKDGEPPSKPPDSDMVSGAITQTEQVITDLDARHSEWLRWRPWLQETWRFHGRLWRWAGRLVAFVALLAVVALTVSEIRDPIKAGDVEKELREMEPAAALVNCSGDDDKDRWTCTLVMDACETAQSAPQPCEGNVVQATGRLQAEADEGKQDALMRLTGTALDRSKECTPSRGGGRPVWLRRLFHKEPPVDLASALLVADNACLNG